MRLHLSICREQSGEWVFKGFPGRSVRRFRDLAEGLSWAEHECSAAPAQIEIRIDDFYVFVDQKIGWPRKICGVGSIQPTAPETGGKRITSRGFRERLRQGFARWRKSTAANARANSGSKGEVFLRAAAVLFSRGAADHLEAGKHRLPLHRG